MKGVLFCVTFAAVSATAQALSLVQLGATKQVSDIPKTKSYHGLAGKKTQKPELHAAMKAAAKKARLEAVGKNIDIATQKIHTAKKTAAKKVLIAQKQKLQAKAFEEAKKKANNFLWRRAKKVANHKQMPIGAASTKKLSLESEIKNANKMLWKKARKDQVKKENPKANARVALHKEKTSHTTKAEPEKTKKAQVKKENPKARSSAIKQKRRNW